MGRSMIDEQRFESLKAEIGLDGMSLLAGVFLDEADQIMDQLISHETDLASGLHALHGSALNLGLKQLAQLCSKAEKAAQDKGGQFIDMLEISTSYHQSRAAFMAALNAT